MWWHILKFMAILAFFLPARCTGEVVVLNHAAEKISLVDRVAYVEDPEGTLQVTDLLEPEMAGRFRPVRANGGDVNFGYSTSVYWLRLELSRPPDADAQWLLEVAYPSLDRIALYSPQASGEYVLALAGDHLPFAARPFPHRNFVFPIALAAGSRAVFFLRVSSQGSLTLPLNVWRQDVFEQHGRSSYALLSLYYGMLLALAAYNLLLYVSLREPIYLLYVAFVTSMAVGQLSLNGLGNQYLWPAWPEWGNLALLVGFSATGLFGALFTRKFLETRRLPGWDWLVLTLAGGFALAVLAAMLAPYREVAMATSLLGVSFSGVAVVAAILALRRGHHGARYFLLAWLLLLVGVAVMGMRNFGWLPTNPFTTYAMQIGSALEMLLLAFALADRINAMRRDKEQAQQQLLRAREQQFSALQKVERTLEGRVAERTRALMDANKQLAAQEERLRGLAHHDSLTGLPNRLLLQDRLEHAIAKARREQSGVAVLWIDLDHFKPVNDRFGHAAGDGVLCELGQRFRACLRDADTVARLGGDEFVVVLDDLHSREDAYALADEIVAEAARPMAYGSIEIGVGASVGIAYWPEDGRDAAAILQQADAAMYQAKNSGRQCWQSVAAA